MAYATYTTDAVVCGSKDSYTSDRSYLLFTKEAGMLWASARSVRMERSKQRYALQDFSIIRVSLIKGRSGWRVGSVEAISNPFMEGIQRSSRAGVAAVVKLLRRFVHGEEAHSDIFDDTVMVLSCIAAATEDDVVDLQEQFTLRLLYRLGYVAPDDAYNAVLQESDPWSVPYVLPPEARRAIKRALSVSHL